MNATLPCEYKPVELTATQSSHRTRMESLGFVVARRPYRSIDGLRWHCSRLVDGVEREFGVCLSTGHLLGWGCGTAMTAAEVDRTFRQPEVSIVTGSPAPDAQSSPAAAVSEAPALYAIAGFTDLICSPGLGRHPKYFASRADKSRWLLDWDTGIHTCFSSKPWQTYTIWSEVTPAGERIAWPVSMETKQRYQETPLASAPASGPAIIPVPPKIIPLPIDVLFLVDRLNESLKPAVVPPATIQRSLFGD